MQSHLHSRTSTSCQCKQTDEDDMVDILLEFIFLGVLSLDLLAFFSAKLHFPIERD